MTKLQVAVIFGGTNTEHEVSLVSARAVINNLDKSKYDVIPIKITKENIWISPKELKASYQPVIPKKIISAEKIDRGNSSLCPSRLPSDRLLWYGPRRFFSQR
ncbi:MAG: hypothetical protein ABII21_03500 [bacterium]